MPAAEWDFEQILMQKTNNLQIPTAYYEILPPQPQNNHYRETLALAYTQVTWLNKFSGYIKLG